ncbi:protein CFAP20DC [Tachyglossus aculeatus]|uniref:protein CFAP20DC n=1 Tax=Tachyglossus aculeatus TaxID=9261 RepID=UPI0018F5E1F6|nr:protein CFAP20DC [Tachyglossus aculeatus]
MAVSSRQQKKERGRDWSWASGLHTAARVPVVWVHHQENLMLVCNKVQKHKLWVNANCPHYLLFMLHLREEKRQDADIGGPFVEIFSAQGKNPGTKWKMFGNPSVIWKEFDKDAKSFVFALEGSSQTIKMQLPKESKQVLGLIQRFLVLQIYVPLGKDFSTELLITDLGNIKRRLFLSTVFKELSATPLHAKIPLFIIKRQIWCNLCIDMVAFTSEIFKGAIFQSLDGIIVSANCKLRKIFTLKSIPQDMNDKFADESSDIIPRSCQFTKDVPQITQLLNMTKLPIHPNEIYLGPHPLTSGEVRLLPDQLINRGPSSSWSSKNQNVSHIAFGSKVSGRPRPFGRGHSMRTSGEAKPTGIRSNKSSQVPSTGKGTDRSEISASQLHETADQGGNEYIYQKRQTSSNYAVLHIGHPHPPKEPSAEQNYDRRLYFKSAGKEKMETPNGSSSGINKNENKAIIKPNIASCERMIERETVKTFSMQAKSPNRTVFLKFSKKISSGSQYQKIICMAMLSLFLLQRKYFKVVVMSMSAFLHEQRDVAGSIASMLKTLFSRASLLVIVSGHLMLKWIFPENCKEYSHLDSRKQSIAHGDNYCNNLCQLPEVNKENENNNQVKEMQTNAEVFTFSSMPRLAPYGKSKKIFSELRPLPLALKEDNKREKRGAQMEDDFCGSDSNEEEYNWRKYQLSQMSITELNMLASMRRQQKEELEDSVISHLLNASQFEKYNISMSSSSDDTTYLSPPTSQGRYYQKEMNPPHSNPRDWLNMFSPPFIPSCEQPMECKHSSGNLNIQGEDSIIVEEAEEILTLLYDPCLNCYFDPQTGKYYELA